MPKRRLTEQPTPEHEIGFSFEKWLSLELPKQYEAKRQALEKNGLLVALQNFEIGYKGVDRVERCMPRLEDIEREILKHREQYEEWMKKGFTDIEITPFGHPLEKMVEVVSVAILKHHRDGKLLSDESRLEVSEDEPLWVWPELVQGDTNGELKYLVNKFAKGQGKTKQQILDSTATFPGYSVYLREQNLYIPKVGEDKIMGGRKQIEAGMTAEEYLQIFHHEGTRGMTPEDYLTLFLTRLEDSNQVLDDLNTGAACLCVGAFHESEVYEPVLNKKVCHTFDAYWRREYQRATLGGAPISEKSPNFSARPAVEVGRFGT